MEIINMIVDKYYIETKNPLLKIFLRLRGEPVTKKEYKIYLIKKYLTKEEVILP